MTKATVSLFLDTRSAKDEKTGTVKLLITHKRVQRLYTTGIKVGLSDWTKLRKSKGMIDGRIKDEELIQIHKKLYDRFKSSSGIEEVGFVKRAQTIIDQLGNAFTFDIFRETLEKYDQHSKPIQERDNVIHALVNKAATMRSQGRIGNGLNYELAAKSIQRFVASMTDEMRKEFDLPIRPKRSRLADPIQEITLRFAQITAGFLSAYEQWMQHFGKAAQSPTKVPTPASLTTVGIYLRHLRAVVNDAITEGILAQNVYPFGRGKYVIPAGTNTKKALTKEDIQKLMGYACIPGSMEERGRDLWLFSYLCNGMNLADICQLRWADVDIKSNKITFTRQKTARSRKGNQVKIVVRLFPESWAVIERWSGPVRRPAAYVFPFLSEDMDANRQKRVIHQVTKMTNKWMNRIAQAVSIDADVNSYSARHSFATILLKSEAPLVFISQALGHTNLKTTQSYLGSFDDENAKMYLEALL